MPFAAGTLLNNRYRIISILGQGGMGAVYRAIDEHLGVQVAVKENLFLAEEYARQFQREASILGGLRQASLPRVRDYFGVPGQGQYLVMDYIEGEDLRKRIERQGKLPDRDVVLIGAVMCDALTYLHTRKPPIVHRDLKPGNIKISPEGEAFLVDFGLAKIMSGSQATSTGARAMTPGFSPPEQYGTARTDPRTDLYSLGATLYAALTGTVPEDGLARATGKEELTSIRQLEGRANRRLTAAIEKALEIDPDERFQTADEFRKALVECGELSPNTINRLSIPPPPDKPPLATAEEVEDSPFKPVYLDEPEKPARPRSRPRRKRTGWIVSGLLAVLLAGAGLLAVWYNPDLPARLVGFYNNPTPTASATPSPTSPPPTSAATLPVSLPPSTLTPTGSPTPTITRIPPTETKTPTQAPTGTPPSNTLPQVAFASNRSGTFQIWMMNADGSSPTQITNIVNGACQPAWSPDGLQIAFISPCMGKDNYAGARIHTMKADGTDGRPLPVPNNLEGDYEPAWSPDGKKIAFTSRAGGFTYIHLYNIETGKLSNISGYNAFDTTPAWSPNGKLIAFTRQSVTTQIWLMGENGENQVPFNVGDKALLSFGPAWTSDGQMIVFSQTKISFPIPWLQALRLSDQGTNRDFRLPPGGQDLGPATGVNISPDGLWILYEGWPDGKNHEIYRISINGADRMILSSDPAFDFGAAWRPGNR